MLPVGNFMLLKLLIQEVDFLSRTKKNKKMETFPLPRVIPLALLFNPDNAFDLDVVSKNLTKA